LRLLVTAWLVNSLLSASSYPILAVTGEQGSGKTTFCRALQKLIDPHEMEGRSPPRNEEDLAVAAQHAHVLVYENMSGISRQLSDSMSRVATGAGFAGRKLFTDDDERQLRYCKPILLNGIDDLTTRSDFTDRVVSVQLEQIPSGRRMTEADLWETFADLQPQLLATLLDLLAKVLATGNVDVPLERMAEYSRLGAKVAIALGLAPTAFSDAYRVNRDFASDAALESSSIGPVIMRMVSQGRFHGLVTGLLHDLRAAADPFEQRHADWPTTPRALGGELRRIKPNLARMGISVTFQGRRRDGHWVTIEAVAPTHGHNDHNGHEGTQTP
jgi:putative DNA primase/helicase